MKIHKLSIFVLVAAGFIEASGICFAQTTDEEVAASLGEYSEGLWLPSLERIEKQPSIEAKLVSFGEKALPVLERELRLSIRFPELNELLRNRTSHRWAAALILTKIPGEKSTGLLYRAAFDPADNGAMQIMIERALAERKLTDKMALGLLNHSRPSTVLIGIGQSAGKNKFTNDPRRLGKAYQRGRIDRTVQE